MLLREDIESGLVAIGTIVRSPTGAGVLLDGLAEPVWGVAVGMLSVEDSPELVLDEGIGSDARGALTTADAGFFVNLWWSVCEEGVVTAAAAAATGREGMGADSGRGTIGNAGASGRWIRLCCLGVAVSPARAGTMTAIVRTQMHMERVTVGLFLYEDFWIVTSVWIVFLVLLHVTRFLDKAIDVPMNVYCSCEINECKLLM